MDHSASTAGVKFDPGEHYHNVFEAFSEFINSFEYTYEALGRAPPPGTTAAQTPAWTNLDKKKILLGKYSSRAFQKEFESLVAKENRNKTTFIELVQLMEEKYAPARNHILANYEFHRLVQQDENFETFSNRVTEQANSCQFKCDSADCNIPNIMIRDQLIFGTNNTEIRQQALKQQWNLKDLLKNARVIETATFSSQHMQDNSQKSVSRVRPGRYSKKTRQKNSQQNLNSRPSTSTQCETCSNKLCHGGKKCLAYGKACFLCGKSGHFKGSKACSGQRPRTNTRKAHQACAWETNEEQTSSSSDEPDEHYDISHVKTVNSLKNSRYEVKVYIKGQPVNGHADTGADINVMSLDTAHNLKLPMSDSTLKIRPYGSKSIKTVGYYEGTVKYRKKSSNTQFYIISSDVETLLSGKLCEELGILTFTSDGARSSVANVQLEPHETYKAKIFKRHPAIFKGVGTLKNHVVHFFVDNSIPPSAQPERPIPYHLQERFQKAIQDMIQEDIIEPHEGPAPWISNPVLTPKDNDSIRVTLDMRIPNTAIKTTNLPIPRVDDVKTKLSGSKYFSKLDLKAAFHQLKLDKASRALTVFHAAGRLMRYKRLTMGAKPASGELNKALLPLFASIPHCSVIHDDIIIAAPSLKTHDQALDATLKILEAKGLTLNAEKCLFQQNEIPFWGLIISQSGIKPDPAKTKALNEASRPDSKDDVMSFLCFTQSFSDFIPRLSRKTHHLRAMTKKNAVFSWTKQCETEFNNLKKALSEKTLIAHYNPRLPTAIFVDAHATGISAILTQENTSNALLPVAFASRATRPEEQRYPQLDLEALAIDFGLRRFRKYIAGGPPITIHTDHKPLVSIFHNSRKGSIRTDRIKLRHQDLVYKLEWTPGKANPADYLSRHACQLIDLPPSWNEEAKELQKTVWRLQSGPDTNTITMKQISKETNTDSELAKLKQHIMNGQIPKDNAKLKAYNQIFDELAIVKNIIFKGNQIVLPSSLRQAAVDNAHEKAHFGIVNLKRRIRSHFWFPDMNNTIEEAVKSCSACQMFTNKRTHEPARNIPMPKNPWEVVSVDLFGPLPNGNYVIMVQDVLTRFPAGKIIRSTAAKYVIPALQQIYINYGSPDSQRTDNGPPFNSKEFTLFCDNHGIRHMPVFPYHPQANPVETIMKPMGKALKIAIWQKKDQSTALNDFIREFRATPHIATGEAPGDLFLRGGYKQGPTRNILDQTKITAAYTKDKSTKQERNQTRNKSHRKASGIQIGDKVITRNMARRKFDPVFGPDTYTVKEVRSTGAFIQRLRDGKEAWRHMDDMKPINQDKELVSHTTTTQTGYSTIPAPFNLVVHEDLIPEPNNFQPQNQTEEQPNMPIYPNHIQMPTTEDHHSPPTYPTFTYHPSPFNPNSLPQPITCYPNLSPSHSMVMLAPCFSPNLQNVTSPNQPNATSHSIPPNIPHSPITPPNSAFRHRRNIQGRPQTPAPPRKRKPKLTVPRALKALEDFNSPGYLDQEETETSTTSQRSER